MWGFHLSGALVGQRRSQIEQNKMQGLQRRVSSKRQSIQIECGYLEANRESILFK